MVWPMPMLMSHIMQMSGSAIPLQSQRSAAAGPPSGLEVPASEAVEALLSERTHPATAGCAEKRRQKQRLRPHGALLQSRAASARMRSDCARAQLSREKALGESVALKAWPTLLPRKAPPQGAARLAMSLLRASRSSGECCSTGLLASAARALSYALSKPVLTACHTGPAHHLAEVLKRRLAADLYGGQHCAQSHQADCPKKAPQKSHGHSSDISLHLRLKLTQVLPEACG